MVTTVTGFTAERSKQIEDETIVDATLADGQLILITRAGTPINVGSVVGPAGPAGTAVDLAGYSEPLNDIGNASGAVELDFDTHNVWRINPTGDITISFANLPIGGYIAPGTLIIANSTHTITWPVETKFPGGEPPELDGETWLTMVARSTHVVVGTAWVGVA